MRFSYHLALISKAVFICLFAAPGTTAAAETRYAVLVGIEDYQSEQLRTPLLKYPIEDVTELAEVLRPAGYQVSLLTDETGGKDAELTPTRANIEAAIRNALRNCKRGDTVLVALAGHGVEFNSEAYFCPEDARPFADETTTLVSISGIYREMEKSFAGVKLMLVDACRNDPDPSRGRSVGVTADNAPPPRGVGVLFSCSPGQRAFEHDSLRHGVFFHYVLDRLRTAGGEGVDVYDIAQHVSRQVPLKVPQLIAEQQQSPNLKADLFGPPALILPERPGFSKPIATDAPKDGPPINVQNGGLNEDLFGIEAGDESQTHRAGFDGQLRTALAFRPAPKKLTYDAPTSDELTNYEIISYERNGRWVVKQKGTTGKWVRVLIDNNRDGNIDEWRYYANGKVVHSEQDTNWDGKPDQFGLRPSEHSRYLRQDSTNENESKYVAINSLTYKLIGSAIREVRIGSTKQLKVTGEVDSKCPLAHHIVGNQTVVQSCGVFLYPDFSLRKGSMVELENPAQLEAFLEMAASLDENSIPYLNLSESGRVFRWRGEWKTQAELENLLGVTVRGY